MPEVQGLSPTPQTAAPNVLGSELKFSFHCPKCRDLHSVEWKNLGKTMRCRNCNVQFRMDRTQFTFFHHGSLPRTSYSCPRCKGSGSVPTNTGERRVQCVRCGLSLFLGPNGQFCSAEQLAAIVQARLAPKQVSRMAAWAYSFMDRVNEVMNSKTLRWPAVCGMLVLLAAGAYYGWHAYHGLAGTDSVSGMASRFTSACLDGEKNAPLAYVADDPLQRGAFGSFQIIHFASLSSRVRPSGDRVTIKVEPIHESEQAAQLKVVVQSPFVGERSHTQNWTCVAGRWMFDAQQTMSQ